MVIYIGFKIASFTFVLMTHFHNYKFLLKYFFKLDKTNNINNFFNLYKHISNEKVKVLKKSKNRIYL